MVLYDAQQPEVSYISFTMIWIICIALFYLLLTSAVLIRNHFEFEALTDTQTEESDDLPLVSICIPARNEVTTIDRCVTSALKQDYPNFEVLVLDDQSTDGTTEILEELSGIIHNLKHLIGAEKPTDWLGKPWACHQLSEAATGHILIFIDADVWLESDVIQKTVTKLQTKDAITIWPQQILGSFWEQLIVPMVYHALFTLLPSRYVERSPRWMPARLKETMNLKFAAACGQFFAFNRSAYEAINGHRSVKHHVVEDVELAKQLKAKGLLLQMLHGRQSVYCRMYQNHSEVWNGFRKNFMSGFNNLFEFFFMWIVHILVFLFPLISLFEGVITHDQSLLFLSAITLTIPVFQRSYLAFKFKWNILFSILHIAGVLWFQIMAFFSVLGKIFGVKATWKGRSV
jgi:chlorobactene glucosyltransferase